MLSPQHIVWIRIRPILELAGFVFLVKYSLDFNSANPDYFTCLDPRNKLWTGGIRPILGLAGLGFY